MRHNIRAIVYGVGEMGSIATRMLLDKGVDIVGAIARSPEKVGRDLGDVAGLGRELKVPVEDDAERVLSTRTADIALLPLVSYMGDLHEHVERCVVNGVNVITICEEALYPWNTSPLLTAQLDRLARQHGVTVTGSGHQDAYWVNLVSLLMGTAHRIDTVHGTASWNVDDYGPEVARDAHVGETKEEFDAFLQEEGWPPGFSRNAVEAIAADVGFSVRAIEEHTRPTLADKDIMSKALGTTIPAGNVNGFVETATLHTGEGASLTFEMIGRIYDEGEADMNEWVVKGDPEELHLSNPRVPTALTTCTQFVNRIPDVINAPPGFITMEKLPQLRYRAFPLHTYIRG